MECKLAVERMTKMGWSSLWLDDPDTDGRHWQLQGRKCLATTIVLGMFEYRDSVTCIPSMTVDVRADTEPLTLLAVAAKGAPTTVVVVLIN